VGNYAPRIKIVISVPPLPIVISAQIREDIRHHGINIYPSAYGAEDEEDAATNAKIEVCYGLLMLPGQLR